MEWEEERKKRLEQTENSHDFGILSLLVISNFREKQVSTLFSDETVQRSEEWNGLLFMNLNDCGFITIHMICGYADSPGSTAFWKLLLETQWPLISSFSQDY